MTMQNISSEPVPLLKTEEAARFLRISKSALEKGRAAGNQGYPAFCRIGKSSIRYRREDLASWVEANLEH